MAFVITSACIGTKDRSCVEVCPVDCFYDIGKKKSPKRNYNEMYNIPAKDGDEALLMIHPDECIHCGACESECPTGAIFEDKGVAEKEKPFVKYAEEELLELADGELDGIRCTNKP